MVDIKIDKMNFIPLIVVVFTLVSAAAVSCPADCRILLPNATCPAGSFCPANSNKTIP